MPTSNEVVPNTKLAGHELKNILRADFDKLLENEGLLSSHIAFGRIGYTLEMRLHTDNPYYPESSIRHESRQVASNIVDKDPKLSAIERSPLDNPSEDALVSSTQLDRNITSPNAERVRHGMPVPAIRRQLDGTTTTEQITYPKDSLPDLPEEDMTITDTSSRAAADWGQPLPPSPQQLVEDAEVEARNSRLCHCGCTSAGHALSGICTKCGEAKCPTFRHAAIPLPDAPPPQAWPVKPGDGSDMEEGGQA